MMYKKILVALENSENDKALFPHVNALAEAFESNILILHVAEGWGARHYQELLLKESEEMIQDRKYIEEIAKKLTEKGLNAKAFLALGNPPQEILKTAEKEKCDLIVMTSHGHGLLADLFWGSTIEEVRHKASIPILAIKSTTTSSQPKHH